MPCRHGANHIEGCGCGKRKQQLLDGLQAEIAVARAKAKAVMAAID